MLAGRYLRTRRREGFVSVIAGFSFLGIMLGVATLIIVLSVMNGFRKELLDKIVGINGHIFVAPIDRPLTDYAESPTASPSCRACAGHPARRGAGLRSSQYNGSGVLVRGVRGSDISASRRSPATCARARSRISTRPAASPSAGGSPRALACRSATPSR